MVATICQNLLFRWLHSDVKENLCKILQLFATIVIPGYFVKCTGKMVVEANYTLIFVINGKKMYRIKVRWYVMVCVV